MPLMMGVVPLTGYEHMVVRRGNVLVLKSLATTVRGILETDTLYGYAARSPDALVLQGRAPVYAVPLGPAGDRVVVRHAVRGGLVGRFVHDRFLPPTRAAREMVTAFRLTLSGVPTPDVIAVATYPAGAMLRRADVVTRYIDGSADLAAVLADARNDEHRRPILDAVALLLTRLGAAGAQHPDLNLRNVLLSPAEDGYIANVLDVDRVNFHVPGDPLVTRANLARLVHSLRKWRARMSARAGAISDRDISYLALASAGEPG